MRILFSAAIKVVQQCLNFHTTRACLATLSSKYLTPTASLACRIGSQSRQRRPQIKCSLTQCSPARRSTFPKLSLPRASQHPHHLRSFQIKKKRLHISMHVNVLITTTRMIGRRFTFSAYARKNWSFETALYRVSFAHDKIASSCTGFPSLPRGEG